MLHLIMTLLIHGVYMETVKCPESCTCIQTLISSSSKVTSVDGIVGTSPNRNENAFKSELNDVEIIDSKLKIISVNDHYSSPRVKKCGEKNKNYVRNIFVQNYSIKSVKVSETAFLNNFRTKRTLKLSDTDNAKFNKTNANLVLSKSKSGLTEKLSGNRDTFTYQITCARLRDLKSFWIHYLPGPATELNIQKTNFQSFKAFQQILKASSTELSQLTVLSVSDSVINQKSDKRYSIKTELKNKKMIEKGNRWDFLPFASLQNPKPRSESEEGFLSHGKCRNLQVLSLTNTTIVYFPKDMFRPFINLQVLNLSNNLVEFFEDDTFSPLINLLQLDIHNNRLQYLSEFMFQNLSKLMFLDVSQNLITNIEPSTFQYLTSLNALILGSNPLSDKQEVMVLLNTGKRLQVVDISKTGLKQIPGTLERSVRVLNLMGNLLLSIRCGDLDSYSLLTYLNLKGNKISYVEDDALGRLEFLKNLQISENNLFQVPKILPNNLEILNLSYNNIQNITNLDFLNLSLLKELLLNYNQITNIEEKAFNALVHLKVLDLSRNSILVLPNIYGQIKLMVLDLSYFTNIPGSYNTKYKQFPVLSPQSVKHLNLESSPTLTKIFLQDTKTLDSFSRLEELNLRFTNLTTIRKDFFRLLPELKVLKVEGNPWHCGKEILTLSNWLKIHQNVGSSDDDEDEVNTAHCLTPPQLYKINLITLEEDDFKKNEKENDNQKTNSIKTKSRGESSIVKLEKFMNMSEKNSSEFSSVEKVSLVKYNKSSANLTFLLRNSTAKTLNSEHWCENFIQKFNSSRKNSVAAYLLPSKRESVQKESSSFLKEQNFVSWRNSSTVSKIEIKNSLGLKSRQATLTTLKKAEAVTAKDTLYLKKEYNSHLSFLILSSIAFVAMATVTFTSLYFARTRRDQSYQRQNQDIEVCSISSLGNELW